MRKLYLFFYLAWVILSIGSSSIALAKQSSNKIEKFIVISDIHFDPFAGCQIGWTPCATLTKLQAANYQDWDNILIETSGDQFSKPGHDTNYPLFAATLEAIQQISETEKLNFGLILGDFLAHGFRWRYMIYSHDRSITGYQAFVKKTLQFITYQFHQALPKVNIYPVIGNNDSYTGDYQSVPGGSFFRETAETWSYFFNDEKNKKELWQTFPVGGYYAITLPQGNQRLILLNTVLFSQQANNIAEAAKEELHWLHDQLALAKQQNQRVILVCHIPVGIDVYNTFKNKLHQVKEYWQPQYQAMFLHELTQFSTVIQAILIGHVHMDAAQLIKTSGSTVLPVSFVPAISPIFGNNPGFKVYSYAAQNFKLKDFSVYYLPLNRDTGWQKEYDFNQVYQPKCKACWLIDGMQKIISPENFVHYKDYYAVGNSAQPITRNPTSIFYYWCNLQTLNKISYRECVKP